MLGLSAIAVGSSDRMSAARAKTSVPPRVALAAWLPWPHPLAARAVTATAPARISDVKTREWKIAGVRRHATWTMRSDRFLSRWRELILATALAIAAVSSFVAVRHA